MKEWKFQLGEDIRIKISGETGRVVARAEYSNGCEDGFNIHYKAADGRACTSWFDASMLEKA